MAWSVSRAAQLLHRPVDGLRLVVAHLGGGCVELPETSGAHHDLLTRPASVAGPIGSVPGTRCSTAGKECSAGRPSDRSPISRIAKPSSRAPGRAGHVGLLTQPPWAHARG